MKLLTSLWVWVQGKKTVITALLGLTITFSFAQGYIDKAWAEYLSGALLILAGGANYANAVERKRLANISPVADEINS